MCGAGKKLCKLGQKALSEIQFGQKIPKKSPAAAFFEKTWGGGFFMGGDSAKLKIMGENLPPCRPERETLLLKAKPIV